MGETWEWLDVLECTVNEPMLVLVLTLVLMLEGG